MNGLLVIDKPSGMTSREVVNRVQRWFPRRTKIGHTGTLDPLATGVLVLCVGSATKLVESIQNLGKTYQACVRLGCRSDTDDADGELTPSEVSQPVALEAIQEMLTHFLGMIQQVPPQVSAVKISGKRAYDLARRGHKPELTARPVRIDAIRVSRYVWPYLDFEIECGKGTYIRSIARDLGEKLGCGGLVQTLRRTRVGPYTAEQAIGIETSPTEARSRLLQIP